MNISAEDLKSSSVLKDRVKIGSSLADVDPMNIDRSVSFSEVPKALTQFARLITFARWKIILQYISAETLSQQNILKHFFYCCAKISSISQVNFKSVGGLGKHVRALKEMIVFPLLYPEVFERFKLAPPRGVLFYGPPGN